MSTNLLIYFDDFKVFLNLDAKCTIVYSTKRQI